MNGMMGGMMGGRGGRGIGGGGMGGMGGGGGGMGGGGGGEVDFGGGGGESESHEHEREAIAELGAALNVWDKNPQNEAVLKALDQPLTISFAKPTPLSDVLAHVKSAATKAGNSLPIYVDPRGLEAAEVKPDSKVTIDLEGVPLKTSLRLLLKQLYLAYCVRDGVVIISSVEGVREELTEAVRELMGSGKNYDEIDMRVLNRTGVIKMMVPMGRGFGGGAGLQ
jgi:hypothetical protein